MSNTRGVGHDDTLRKQCVFWPHNKMALLEPRARDRNEIVVHYVPKHLRPLPDDLTCGEKDDVVTVTFLGESFLYAIPSFDVLGVELRPVGIKKVAV